MKRDLGRLVNECFDVLIVGGGIYGAALARAATLRGLTVALVEQGDFGHSTSSNSLKVIHGGLRYLQRGDLKRMRESIISRKRLLKIAPHLVHPQGFVIPTYGHGLRSREIMAVALAINGLVSCDRNRSVHPTKHIPVGRTMSKHECLEILPSIDKDGLTGGVLWFDCIARNTERLTLAFILSAAEEGACVANYVRADKYLCHEDTIRGVAATDCITSKTFDVRSKVLVLATGSWLNELTKLIPHSGKLCELGACAKAVNIVIKRPLFAKYAIGLTASRGYVNQDALLDKATRYYFFVPWRGGTLIGTSYKKYSGAPTDCKVREQDIIEIIHEVNHIYPPAELTVDDVSFFHAGLLPIDSNDAIAGGQVRLKEHAEIYDYKKITNVDGLLAVSGVKYTTAHQVAEKVLDLVVRKLGRKRSAKLLEPPLCGGEWTVSERFVSTSPHEESIKTDTSIDSGTISHLRQQYGSQYGAILAYLQENESWAEAVATDQPTIVAEVIHGIREEMALALTDVLLRRTELGSFAHPGRATIRRCGEIMAQELGWNRQKMENELDTVEDVYKIH